MKTKISLQKLIKQCKRGDKKSQAQVYQIYAGKLFAVCLKYSQNKQQAEDNLHDSYMTIFNKIKQYNSQGSFEGWLKRITINTCLQKYRKHNVSYIVTEDYPDIEEFEINENEISLDYLLEIIQKLPDQYRLVFNLYVLDGYSHKEIAELLNISIGTSKSNLSRARLKLKEEINTNYKNKY